MHLLDETVEDCEISREWNNYFEEVKVGLDWGGVMLERELQLGIKIFLIFWKIASEQVFIL